MKKTIVSWLASLGVLALLSGPAGAATLSILPSVQGIAGVPATADVVVSGLTAAGPLGGFEIEILFDDGVLDFASAGFGGGLGAIISSDPLDFSADAFGEITPGAGSVLLVQASYLSDLDLDALQSDSFTLATLVLSGHTRGSSALSFGTAVLTNAFGNEFAGVTLNDGAVDVPAPATVPLMLSALGLLGYLRARGKRRAAA